MCQQVSRITERELTKPTMGLKNNFVPTNKATDMGTVLTGILAESIKEKSLLVKMY